EPPKAFILTRPNPSRSYTVGRLSTWSSGKMGYLATKRQYLPRRLSPLNFSEQQHSRPLNPQLRNSYPGETCPASTRTNYSAGQFLNPLLHSHFGYRSRSTEFLLGPFFHLFHDIRANTVQPVFA